MFYVSGKQVPALMLPDDVKTWLVELYGRDNVTTNGLIIQVDGDRAKLDTHSCTQMDNITIHDDEPSAYVLEHGVQLNAEDIEHFLGGVEQISNVSGDFLRKDLTYFLVSTSQKTLDMHRFLQDFMCRTKYDRNAGEIVIIGSDKHEGNYCAFYGVSIDNPDRDSVLKINRRLSKRKSYALHSGNHPAIQALVERNATCIRTTKFIDFNSFVAKIAGFNIIECHGVDMADVLFEIQARSSKLSTYMPTNPQCSSSGPVNRSQRVSNLSDKIKRALPISPSADEIKLTPVVTAKLLRSGAIDESEEREIKKYRPHIELDYNESVASAKASETAEAKAKRLKTVEDERRALAESYVQKIREYCSKRVDEYGFCNLKNAYTHKILSKLVGDEIITSRESVEAESVQDEIDELLEDARTKNAQRNKGDLAKAKQLARRLLEIFFFEFERFDDDELGKFNSDPREYVYRNVYDSNYDFGATDRALFGGVHYDMIVSTVRAGYEKVKQAGQMFVDAEKLRRSEEVEDNEREAFELSQRVRREVNDEIMSDLPSLEALQTSKNGALFGGFIGNSFKEKHKQYKRDPSGFTPEEIAVFKEEERLAPIRTRLYERYNAQTVEELKARIRPLEEYVRDLEPFEPTAEEVREYIRTNFTIICDNLI